MVAVGEVLGRSMFVPNICQIDAEVSPTIQRSCWSLPRDGPSRQISEEGPKVFRPGQQVIRCILLDSTMAWTGL